MIDGGTYTNEQSFYQERHATCRDDIEIKGLCITTGEKADEM